MCNHDANASNYNTGICFDNTIISPGVGKKLPVLLRDPTIRAKIYSQNLRSIRKAADHGGRSDRALKELPNVSTGSYVLSVESVI